MNLIQLKYAVEVAKAGSLNKAAESLFIGQPNISRAIKDLETSLGITIFSRSSRGMLVTPEGDEFLNYARKILAEIDAVENLYKSEKRQKQRFSISVPRASYISEAFSRFSKNIDINEPAELFYKETNSMRAIKNIIESDYRLGIIRYAENHDKYFKEMLYEKGFTYELITEFSYVLIMSCKHPLAAKNDIRYDDLKPYVEIAHADPFVPSIPSAAVKKEELPDDIERRIFVFERASQFDLLSENNNTYMWVSPIPNKLINRYKLVQKPCRDNERKYRDILIYRKEYKLTDLDNLFIKLLLKSKNNIFNK